MEPILSYLLWSQPNSLCLQLYQSHCLSIPFRRTQNLLQLRYHSCAHPHWCNTLQFLRNKKFPSSITIINNLWIWINNFLFVFRIEYFMKYWTFLDFIKIDYFIFKEGFKYFESFKRFETSWEPYFKLICVVSFFTFNEFENWVD